MGWVLLKLGINSLVSLSSQLHTCWISNRMAGQRKPNWTEAEKQKLCDLVEEKHERFGPTKETQNVTWEEIARCLAVAFPGNDRTSGQCKAKWKSMQTGGLSWML
ncbi:hypothetical protein CHARACLAT_021257 [Characodon lateralis]|uniref:Myb-like domain-containing protein n=1 Tax=Characodon lateralis TaxID=208331 RepID=A0ABU7DME2_9TELE|nr:hypothetical protein [Characodon lateralis]